METMPEKKRTGALKKVVFALLPAVLLLLVLEGAARLLPQVAPPAGAAGFMGDGGRIFVEDPLLMWRVKPNLRGAHATNSGGFRDEEFVVGKQPGEFRVLVLGDSTTWGWGVRDGECYPARLEEILQKKMKDGKVSVLNAGVPGYTSYQGKLLFETELKKYKPDLVLAYFGVNDVTAKKGVFPDSVGKRPSPAEARLLAVLRKSLLYSDLRNILLRIKESRVEDADTAKTAGLKRRVSPQEFGKNMAAIREEAESGGAEVLNVAPLWTFRGEIRNDLTLVLFAPKGAYIEKSGNGPVYAAEPVFDPLPAFEESGLPAETLFLDYCHFSPEGHRLLAESLSGRIKSGYRQ